MSGGSVQLLHDSLILYTSTRCSLNSVCMEDFLEVAGPRLPTLRGLKYTSQDLMEFGRCVTAQAERYQIIYGSDQVRCESSWFIIVY